jgi:hypothetical protein
MFHIASSRAYIFAGHGFPPLPPLFKRIPRNDALGKLVLLALVLLIVDAGARHSQEKYGRGPPRFTGFEAL